MSKKFYIVGRERRQRDTPVADAADRRATGNGRPQHFIGLKDRRVSRRHAEVYVVEGRIFLRDLNSKNGTFIIEDGHKKRLTEGYVQPTQLVSFAGCVRTMRDVLGEFEPSVGDPDPHSGTDADTDADTDDEDDIDMDTDGDSEGDR